MGSKIVAGFVVHLLAVAMLAALACIVGQLLRTHGEQLGHGDPRHWSISIAPNAVPRGTWVPRVDPVLEVQAAAPVEIELEDPRQSLLDALARGDGEGAVARFHSAEVSPVSLDGEALIQLAQALAARTEYGTAANLLRALLMRAPNGTAAARASIILARLCAERLDAPAEAEEIYRGVLLRFPGTAAARFAQERLATRS